MNYINRHLEGLPLALTLRYLVSCRFIISFEALKTGRQLLAPKRLPARKAISQKTHEEEPRVSNLILHSTSEPVSYCSLTGDPSDSILRLLNNYHTIALLFLSARSPETTFATSSFLEVNIPLRNGNILRMRLERELRRSGELEYIYVTIALKQDIPTKDIVVESLKESLDPIHESDIDDAESFRSRAALIFDSLRKTPRPWKGSYRCEFENGGTLVLKIVGSVVCRFEKIHSDLMSTGHGFSDRPKKESEKPRGTSTKRIKLDEFGNKSFVDP